jgi:imidazole glycerol-phosphate synthase subunit HisH
MSQQIAIIDYEMGNLRSVQKALEKVGGKAVITRSARTIRNADKVVLPGVGAIGDCMKHLREYKLIDPILETIEQDKPFLGICLGFQCLFEESLEFGRHKCLGVFPGKVVPFELPKKYSIPHMGWNQIEFDNLRRGERPFALKGIRSGTNYYFVHSYYVDTKKRALIATKTRYGKNFVSSISCGNLFACQFHPEKSQGAGLKILKNFVDLHN